ncbi:MAG: bacillithiol biosynthesis cysteine-adding enzyme BshC [Flavobacteriaceae bacterium]
MIRSMDVECLTYRKTGYFTKLITDYLDENKNLRPFCNHFPSLEAFKQQLEEKKASYPAQHRQVLCEVLTSQYDGIKLSKATSNHLKNLQEQSTFTVVTGHQLNLFTGPLYFLYKIISTINLCKELAAAYPEFKFVPVYWMATEDHDFEEINYFNFRGQKIKWNKDLTGAVGRFDTKGLDAVYSAFKLVVGNNERSDYLLQLFKEAYLDHQNLAEATRFIANELFGAYGLVTVDGDDARLKKLLAPYIEQDLLEKRSFQEVSKTIEQWGDLESKYKVQVNPREINYFYLRDQVRERIVENENGFMVNDSDIRFTRKEILKELETHPERFSPNVITRPLYQEVVLPNLCYIGGGGEIAYWLELRSTFDSNSIPFPILLLRNSALVISGKQNNKLKNLNLNLEDVFLKQSSLINKKIREISNINIDLSAQKKHLKEQFENLYKIAELTDKSFMGAVKAQEVKQIKGIDHLEKRLLKAQKRKLKDQVIRMTELQNQLFPNESLQERILNFSELYLEFGPELIPRLMDALKPLKLEFTVIKL